MGEDDDLTVSESEGTPAVRGAGQRGRLAARDPMRTPEGSPPREGGRRSTRKAPAARCGRRVWGAGLYSPGFTT